MLTRKTVEKSYRLSTFGTVVQPGKFQGEPWFVVAVWYDVDLADREDGHEPVYYSFALSDARTDALRAAAEDAKRYAGQRAEVPERPEFLTVWETEQGFVMHAYTTAADLDEFNT